jgi:hypothetical protein
LEDRQLNAFVRPWSAEGGLRAFLFILAMSLATASAPVRADFDLALRAYDAGDYATAFKEWARLAEQGDLAAMRNIGHLYRFGRGTEKNPAKAAEWYRRAAEGGLDRAEANLAALYLTGEGVPQDYAEAAKWFGHAAEQGLPVAEYNLGLLYEHGLGVEQSEAKALGWYNLAAKAGEPHALQKLSELVRKSTPDKSDSPSAEAAKPAPPTMTPQAASGAAPELPKPKQEEGGLLGLLGDIFTSHPTTNETPGKSAPASTKPMPVDDAATAAPKSTAADAKAEAKGDSFGDGVLHALGTVFTTNPKAGRRIDEDPTALPQNGRP